ncbi:hypothetical protein [Sphingomonas sp.]|uniref:hypothetical protein n=1 Tax=Sphingomonas sp. TaxID=28214 RepID=UPI001D62032E|nr:hypothetical protein [Sphingomonas sp.]MBX9796886.1 hypothetical protein [Sphingomonas sp.]
MKRVVALGLFALLATDLSIAASAQTAGTPPAKEKLICRREAPIGSLIESRKTCKTREEWQKLADLSRESAEYQQQQGQSRPRGE